MTEADTASAAHFDELFRANVAVIAAYCRWRTRSSADAEDALGEVFLTAWRRLDDVPGPTAEARVWLYATARRVTANQYRAARRRMGLVDRIVESRRESVPPRTAVTENPDADRVHAALVRLAPRDREVLLLAGWEELSTTQIAQVMGCSEGSARTRLHRARKRFRTAFETLTHDRAATTCPARPLGGTDHV
jgi:RNA polymerase sigma-70 factor (ECF subfamily)